MPVPWRAAAMRRKRAVAIALGTVAALYVLAHVVRTGSITPQRGGPPRFVSGIGSPRPPAADLEAVLLAAQYAPSADTVGVRVTLDASECIGLERDEAERQRRRPKTAVRSSDAPAGDGPATAPASATLVFHPVVPHTPLVRVAQRDTFAFINEGRLDGARITAVTSTDRLLFVAPPASNIEMYIDSRDGSVLVGPTGLGIKVARARDPACLQAIATSALNGQRATHPRVGGVKRLLDGVRISEAVLQRYDREVAPRDAADSTPLQREA